MKHLKTYEGFISKIKNLLIPKEEPKEKISANEIKTLIEDRLIELKDNGFSVNVLEGESNERKLIKKYDISQRGVDISFDDKLTKNFEIIIERRPIDDFNVDEVKDSVLSLLDMLNDEYNGITNLITYFEESEKINIGSSYLDHLATHTIQGEEHEISYKYLERGNKIVSGLNLFIKIPMNLIEESHEELRIDIPHISYTKEEIESAKEDVQYLEDLSMELKDNGYSVSVGLTPLTMAAIEHGQRISKGPEIYCNIEKSSKSEIPKEETDIVYSSINSYMKSRGWTVTSYRKYYRPGQLESNKNLFKAILNLHFNKK